MTQWIRDLALSLKQLRSLLWCEFDSWSGNFYMSSVQLKKKKKNHPMVNMKSSVDKDR